MSKRIMTIDELYLFCLKHNFSKFDSKETGSEIVVEMPGLFEKSTSSEDRHTEGMTPFVSRAFHDKINLNKSKIETEVFEDNLPSSHLRPILANIIRDEETNELDFGSHDFHIETVIETNEDGKEIEVEKTVYDEQPIGVIDGSRNAIEYDEKANVNRAVLHGYLYNDYCQDAIDILNRRGTVDCSIELSIRSLSFDAADGVLVLDDFYVSALTLLSAKTRPGMAGSNFKIEDFAVKNNSAKFDKDEKLIELLEKLNAVLTNFNIDQAEFSASEHLKEGGTETVKLNELLGKYGKTVDDITFEYENLSDEELEAKFAEVFGEENTDEEGEDQQDENQDPASDGDKGEGSEDDESGEDDVDDQDDSDDNTDAGESGENNEESGSESEQFAENLVRTYEISHDDIRWALYNLLSVQESADDEWYFINAVYDSYFTYESWSGEKIYGQSYTKENDVIAFDGNRWNLHRELLNDQEYAELMDMRSNYAAISERLAKYQNAEIKAQKEEILSDEAYAEFADSDEFKSIVSEADSLTVEELRTKCDLAFAKLVKAKGTFAFKEITKEIKGKNRIGINSNFEKSEDNEPYGDYFKSIRE